MIGMANAITQYAVDPHPKRRRTRGSSSTAARPARACAVSSSTGFRNRCCQSSRYATLNQVAGPLPWSQPGAPCTVRNTSGSPNLTHRYPHQAATPTRETNTPAGRHPIDPAARANSRSVGRRTRDLGAGCTAHCRPVLR